MIRTTGWNFEENMKTKSLGWLLFLLMLPIIPLFVQAQKTSHIADKFDPVQSGTVPVNEATNPDVLRAQQALQVQSGGRGVAQDFAEAVKWYRKAADQNNPDAQIRLATCYNAGLGVAQDFAEGTKWYRKAAEENCAEAQLYLAGRCKTG